MTLSLFIRDESMQFLLCIFLNCHFRHRCFIVKWNLINKRVFSLLLLLLLLSNKLFKKLSQKLLAVRKHETNKKRWHEQQFTEC